MDLLGELEKENARRGRTCQVNLIVGLNKKERADLEVALRERKDWSIPSILRVLARHDPPIKISEDSARRHRSRGCTCEDAPQ